MITLLPLGLLVAAWLAVLIAGRRRKPPPLRVPATLLDCGCLRVGGGLLLPCAEHDPHAEPPVEQWAADLGREES